MSKRVVIHRRYGQFVVNGVPFRKPVASYVRERALVNEQEIWANCYPECAIEVIGT